MATLDLGSARKWARALQRQAAFPGATVVDATMGNGGDTQALCEMVGDEGRVYAFDVQLGALNHTRDRLTSAGLLSRATLYLAGHEHMNEYVPGPIDLAVFNLGWLPGAADKTITTRVSTTLCALNAALALLSPGGLITVCAYPGHEEGTRELTALITWAKALNGSHAQAMLNCYLNQPAAAPALIAVQKLR